MIDSKHDTSAAKPVPPKRGYRSHRTQIVYDELVKLADENGRVQVATRELGKILDIQQPNIVHCISKLIEMGRIEVTRSNDENGGNNINIYTLRHKSHNDNLMD